MMFSAGSLVGWTINTSRPRIFSSYLIHNSPSAKLRMLRLPNVAPRYSAMRPAKAGLLRPVNIFRSSYRIFYCDWRVTFAGEQGLEPRPPGPKPGVLPLDDSPNVSKIRTDRSGKNQVHTQKWEGVVINVRPWEFSADSARFSRVSSSKIPNTVEPLPDRLA